MNTWNISSSTWNHWQGFNNSPSNALEATPRTLTSHEPFISFLKLLLLCTKIKRFITMIKTKPHHQHEHLFPSVLHWDIPLAFWLFGTALLLLCFVLKWVVPAEILMGHGLPILPGLGWIFTSRRPIDTRLNRFPNQDCKLFDNASTLNLFYLLKRFFFSYKRGKGEFNDRLLSDKKDQVYSSLKVCLLFLLQSTFPRDNQECVHFH